MAAKLSICRRASASTSRQQGVSGSQASSCPRLLASVTGAAAAQILRVISYSSIQLGSYGLLKRSWAD